MHCSPLLLQNAFYSEAGGLLATQNPQCVGSTGPLQVQAHLQEAQPEAFVQGGTSRL